MAARMLPLAAQSTPTISAVLNNFSSTAAGLPNYGIAQGSPFLIFGSDLASTALPVQRLNSDARLLRARAS